MKNVKKIIVDMPTLDRHDNWLSISIHKEKETEGNTGYVLEGAPIASIFELMFNEEFEELTKKYERMVKKFIEEAYVSVDELNDISTNRFVRVEEALK